MKPTAKAIWDEVWDAKNGDRDEMWYWLEPRLATAQTDLAREVRMHQERVGALKLEVSRRLAAETRAEAAEQALRRYGMHKRDCYDGWQPGEDNPESCSCGLAAALAGRGDAGFDWQARAEAAERAMTAALRELERISDVRVNRTKIIGNAALILQEGTR